jgi:hypothetical protein
MFKYGVINGIKWMFIYAKSKFDKEDERKIIAKKLNMILDILEKR